MIGFSANIRCANVSQILADQHFSISHIPSMSPGAMMMKFLFAAASAAFYSIAAQAGDVIYIQANVGSPSSDQRSECTALGVSDLKCSTKGSGGKLLVGYKVTPIFALEGTYWKLGTERIEARDINNVVIAQGDGDISAFGLGGAVHFGITEQWAGVARFGFAKVKSKFTVPIFPTPVDGSYSESNAKFYAGAGVSYSITPMFKLHGDFDYTKVRSEVLDEHGIRLLSIGGSLNF